MADDKNPSTNSGQDPEEREEPVIRDKRRIDPETGDVRQAPDAGASADESPDAEADADAEAEAAGEDTVDEDAATDENAATDEGDVGAADASSDDDALSEEDRALLDQAERDLVAEMRNDMLRAQAELVNFRTRVERDRVANREAVIAEVFRSLLPTIDDLARAEAHGDLVEGAPLTLIAQKLRTAFDKYGLKPVGEKGEPFDPAFHEAVVQLPTPGAAENTIADVIELGYVLGERLVRPAKVAVSVPAE